MDVGGIKRGSGPIDRSRVEQAPAAARPSVTPAPLCMPPAPLAGTRTTDEVTPGEAVQSTLELRRADRDEQFKTAMQPQLAALAAARFSLDAQQHFVAELAKKVTLPEDAPRLAWIANSLWPAVKTLDTDVSTLQTWFNQRGIRLRPTDAVADEVRSFQMDRSGFRAAVKELAGRAPVTRRDVLTLLERVKDVGDLDDLAWARNELDKAALRGLTFAEPRADALARRFFDHRLVGHVGAEELGLAVHLTRVDGFSADSVARVRGLLAGCQENDDGLFFAERQLERSARKALADPRWQSPAAQTRIREAVASLRAELTARLEGKLDRHTLCHALAREYRAGRIDERAFLTLTTTAAASSTVEQFAVGVMTAHAAVQIARTQEMLANAWSDLARTISENMSDDVRDASGRIIETADQRAVKRMLQERLLRRLTIAPQRLKALAQRAHLLGSRQRVLSQLYGEQDPSRRASLESALAGADVQLVEHRPARG